MNQISNNIVRGMLMCIHIKIITKYYNSGESGGLNTVASNSVTGKTQLFVFTLVLLIIISFPQNKCISIKDIR